MTAIKKLIDGNGNQYFPQTHTNAVVDGNGYSVESRMQAVQDVVNQAQMAIGAVPSDLTPTEDSTNWVTSGGVYNAMQVVQSELTELEGEVIIDYNKVYFELGSISNGEDVEYTSAMRTTFVPLDIDRTVSITISSGTPSASYQYVVYYKDGVFVKSERMTISASFSLAASSSYNQFRILLYRSSTITSEQAAASYITFTPSVHINKIESLSDKIDNYKVETIIAEGALRGSNGYNFNTAILSGDSFIIEVGDVNAIASYSISTWSRIDKGGTQVEAINNITGSTIIFTATQNAACLRLYFNGNNHAANITWFTIKKVVVLQAAFEKTSSHLLPIMPSFPSVLKEGMIWIDMPNRLLVDIDSSLISDVSASFLDKEGNIIDCSSLTKNGDAVSFAQSGSCMSLPNYVLGNNFSAYMKFNLHNTTQTSCYMMLLNYNSDTGNQVAVLYNYSNTSKNIQLYIDGTTYDTISLSDTNVHELLVVYDSGLFSVYLDGEIEQSFKRVIKTSPTAYNSVGNTNSQTHPCAMDVSEFRLYNISISPNDI